MGCLGQSIKTPKGETEADPGKRSLRKRKEKTIEGDFSVLTREQ